MMNVKLIGTDAIGRKLVEMARGLGTAGKVAILGAQVVEKYAKREGFRSQGEQIGTKRTKSGKEIAVRAALGAPIADKLTTRTGNLRASIRSEVTGPTQAAVGPTAKYGAIHEFGGQIQMAAMGRRAAIRKVSVSKSRRKGAFSRITSVKQHERGAYTINMPARPYLQPGYAKHVAEVEQAMVNKLAAIIAEAM